MPPAAAFVAMFVALFPPQPASSASGVLEGAFAQGGPPRPARSASGGWTKRVRAGSPLTVHVSRRTAQSLTSGVRRSHAAFVIHTMTAPTTGTFAGDAAVEWLNSISWHDSVLYELRIIRTHSADALVFTLDLLSDWETWVSRRAELHFDGCLVISAEFLGGIIGLSDGEMVSEAEAFSIGPHLERITSKAPMFVTQQHREFHITLASTSSTVCLVFSSVSVTFLSTEQPHDAPPPKYPTP